MPRFKTKTHVTHDNVPYDVGETVEMSAEQAAAIPWAVESVAAPSKSDDKPKAGDKPAKQ